MASIENLLWELSEENLAQKVARLHDEARMRYNGITSNTVRDWQEFERVIGSYYAYHYAITVGGNLSSTDATSLAKELLERHYRREHGNIVTASTDCIRGTNGAVRHILDVLAESMKGEALERFMRQVFDRYAPPNDYYAMKEIVRQFIERSGMSMSLHITAADGEKYARDYEELIRNYLHALRQQSSVFRRL